jgi:localization factor PodJL
VGRDRASDTPADRVAASAAAVAPAKPPVIPDPGGKPDFIAAARRAAQAAAAEKPEQRHRLAGGPPNPEREPLAQRLTKRMRPLLIGVAVAVIAIGAIHVARNFLTEVGPEISVPPTGKAPAAGSSAIPGTRATSTASSEPQPAGAAKQLGNMPTVPTGSSTVPSAGVLDLEALPRTEPPSEPGPRAAPAATGDVTGSVPLPPPQPAATPPARRPAAAATSEPEPADAPLPAKIGGAPLRVAAANGDPAAAYEVGMRYAEGRGIAPNLKEAARWLERAAKHGLAPAQFRLGGLYEKGQGVRKDLAEARRLYVAAAEKGHGKAMHNLAVLYAEGIDGKPDYRTSAQWFRKAADRGIPDSQYNLGILYARGIGVGQNLAESYKWFALAAREGDKEAAKKRDDVAARLDQQSLTAARLAVQTWTAEPQPAAAIEVKAPPGGWDHAVAPAKPRKPARARPHKGASQSG